MRSESGHKRETPTSAPGPAAPPAPTVIAGRYALEAMIGSGGMARVYRASDRVLQRSVAVKVLREECGADPAIVSRFSREARAAAALQQANIVDVYDFGQYADSHYIVMQFVDGVDLKTLVGREGPFPVQRAFNIVAQVLRALAAAHEHGVVHRDVKPQNILVYGDDQVKLTDFGIAHLLSASGGTSSGSTWGTASYMAPEQATGGTIGPAADLYSCGVVLFELLTGHLPYQADSPLQVLLKHQHEPPPRVPNVAPSVDHLVRRALAKDPVTRFGSAASMLAALSAASGWPTRDGASRTERIVPYAATRALAARSSARESSPRRARPVSAPAVATTIILLLLLVGAGLLWSRIILSRGSMNPMVTPTSSQMAGSGPPPSPLAPSAVVTLPARVNTHVPPRPSTAAAPAQASAMAPPATARPTTVLAPPARTGAPTRVKMGAEALVGAYRRTDGTLYGRSEVALYGAGSPYSSATATFQWHAEGRSLPVTVLITGLDDGLPARCDWEVAVNGTVIFRGPTSFPNTPADDNGVGGQGRYWGVMRLEVPRGVLVVGANRLTLTNLTTWHGSLGVPYILVNEVEIAE